VAALPDRQRLAVFLRYYADLDYASIADTLGVKAGTVAAALSAAHDNLRKTLQEALR
jgi:DNA-directed RNA polymerase specialized sigma24 family protein